MLAGSSRPVTFGLSVLVSGAVAVGIVALLSCGASGRSIQNASGDPEPVVRPDPSNDGPKPEHLEVVAMTITWGEIVVFIKADGALERKSKPPPSGKQGTGGQPGSNVASAVELGTTGAAAGGRFATLRRTGELLHVNGGLLLTLNPDGTITSANISSDQFEGFIIEPNGTLTQDELTPNTISPEGIVLQGEQEIAKISGPSEGRRAAMLVLLMLFGEEDPSETKSAEPENSDTTTTEADSDAP